MIWGLLVKPKPKSWEFIPEVDNIKLFWRYLETCYPYIKSYQRKYFPHLYIYDITLIYYLSQWDTLTIKLIGSRVWVSLLRWHKSLCMLFSLFGLAPSRGNNKDTTLQTSPQWYDFVHFGHKPSLIYFWFHPKSFILIELVVMIYIHMIFSLSNRCGTLITFLTYLLSNQCIKSTFNYCVWIKELLFRKIYVIVFWEKEPFLR